MLFLSETHVFAGVLLDICLHFAFSKESVYCFYDLKNPLQSLEAFF